ncbi:TRAP transporter small permease [Sneathiella sp.]|jgi:TRAP-type C4-dicarboxylate transport system permease small subunit|uniref:TRAP transporter small permease n=1 Tax=Sneathiella sp. TaxID=1964365 RepID=UPI0039E2C83F
MGAVNEPQSIPGPKFLGRLESVFVTLSVMAILTMGLLITVSVVSRALFGWSVPDSTIIVRELMIGAVVLPLAYVTATRSHIMVEVLTSFFPDRVQPWLNFFSVLIGLAALSPILYGGVVELMGTIEDEAYFFGDLELPEWPGRAVFAAGYALFILRLIVLVGTDFWSAFTGQPLEDTPVTKEGV